MLIQKLVVGVIVTSLSVVSAKSNAQVARGSSQHTISENAKAESITELAKASVDTDKLRANALFTFYFHHLGLMDSMADDMDRRQIDTQKWRSFEQEKAGVTVTEWTIVRSEASAYRKAESIIEESRNAAVAQRIARRGLGLEADDINLALADISAQRTRALEEAKANLEVALGTASFSKLSAYIVRATETRVVPTSPEIKAGLPRMLGGTK